MLRELGGKHRHSKATRPSLKQEPFLPQTPAPMVPNPSAYVGVFLPRTPHMPGAARPPPAGGPQGGSPRGTNSAAPCPTASVPGHRVGTGRLPALQAQTLPTNMFATPLKPGERWPPRAGKTGERAAPGQHHTSSATHSAARQHSCPWTWPCKPQDQGHVFK